MKQRLPLVLLLAMSAMAASAISQQTNQIPALQAIRLNNLGAAYMNQQKMAEALQAFERAISLDPNLVIARTNHAIALFNNQQVERSRDVLLDEVTQKYPSEFRAWYNLGIAYKSLGQTEPAIAAFSRVAQLQPDDVDTHYHLGLMYAQAQKHQEAIAAFEKALSLSPYHVSAEFGLARSYQRLNDLPKAQEHLARFQRFTQEKLGAPMGLGYGEQGALSIAAFASGPEAVEASVPVRFVSVGAQAGLNFSHSDDAVAVAADSPVMASMGSGACFFDYDNDDHQDLLLLGGGSSGPVRLFRNQGGGRFADATSAARFAVKGYGLGCSAADYDNDGRVDVAITLLDGLVLLRNNNGTLEDVTAAAGIRTAAFPLGVNFIDHDHDGDVDIYVSRFGNSGNVLWRNNGDGKFTDATAATSVAGNMPSVGSVGIDINNDRAIDFVVTGSGATPLIFENPREGPFRTPQLWPADMPPATAGMAIADFDKDGWVDFAFTHAGAPGLSVWCSLQGKGFDRIAVPALNWTRGWGIAAIDYDNDGRIDIAAAGERDNGAELRLWRNRGAAGFEDSSTSTGLAELKIDRPRALISADYDEDGDTDLILTQNNGPVLLLRNDGGNQNGWIRISLRGLNDNKSGIGTKVEIFAGSQRQKWELPGSSGYLGQSSLPVLAGLGSEGQLETVRMLWPTGVWQDEVQLPVRRNHLINEIDRRGSSCPVLFVWNGKQYEFITDVIGAGIVGHWVAPGQRNTSDPTEYVRVDGSKVRLRDGRISMRVVEPMEELVYLDQVKLFAVDHPADLDVYANEYFAASPPFAEFKIITSRSARPPSGAWDEKKRDVLPELISHDRRFVTDFPSAPFRGFAALHGLELDLGDVNTAGPVRLLMTGYIDYFSATSVYAAHQAGITAVAPYVEALNASGRWVRVIDDLGFPAGLWRTMTADLTGKLPAGTGRIRISTNLKIYWDQILIDTTSDSRSVNLLPVRLAEARLSWLGYPRSAGGSPESDVTYIYNDVSQTGPYARHAGNYTNYGNIHPLLMDVDDRFAVYGSGEQVELEFDPSGLPRLPAGWTRDYFFFAHGYAKDMDFYEAYSQTVEPLPFRAMKSYPYPPGVEFPQTPLHLDYLLNTNSRQLSGRPGASFKFRYR